MIQAVLIDLAGVLYDSDKAIPGSVAAIERLRLAGVEIRFVTNSTRAPRRVLLHKLREFGFDLHDDELFTPASAACEILQQSRRTAHLLVHPDLIEDFGDLPNPNHGSNCSVVIGDAADHFSYEAMNSAFRALSAGADFFALALNRNFRDSDGLLSIDVGAFVKALEYASGKTAIVLGKPSSAFFAAALASMDCAPHDAVMIGDDIESDVAGALRANVGRAILVKTGKYQPGSELEVKPAPSFVADDLSAAVQWLLGGKV